MRESRRVWPLLLIVYVIVVEAIDIVLTGRLNLSLRLLATAATVPLAQAVALAVCPARSLTAVSRFFVACLVLALGYGVVAPGTTLALFRYVDLSQTAVLQLLFVPAAQAAVVVALGEPRPTWFSPWRIVAARSMTQPLLALDVLLLTAGWVMPHDPLVGVFSAGVIQRRWMGTKLIVASLFFGAAALRQRPVGQRTRERRRISILAVVLAALALDAFSPWLFDLAWRIPPPLSEQPLALLWLEVYGLTLVGVLFAMLSARDALRDRSPLAFNLIGAAALALFGGALGLLMNGFLSVLPVAPWAGIAITGGSIAATFLAAAALLTEKRSEHETHETRTKSTEKTVVKKAPLTAFAKATAVRKRRSTPTACSARGFSRADSSGLRPQRLSFFFVAFVVPFVTFVLSFRDLRVESSPPVGYTSGACRNAHGRLGDQVECTR